MACVMQSAQEDNSTSDLHKDLLKDSTQSSMEQTQPQNSNQPGHGSWKPPTFNQGPRAEIGPGQATGGSWTNQRAVDANSDSHAEQRGQQRKQQSRVVTCDNMTNYVSGRMKRLTGPGHCDGEVTGHLTNNSSQKVECHYEWREENGKKDRGGATAIGPGRTVGGEMGGMWSCGRHGKVNFLWRCSLPEDNYTCREIK